MCMSETYLPIPDAEESLIDRVAGCDSVRVCDCIGAGIHQVEVDDTVCEATVDPGATGTVSDCATRASLHMYIFQTKLTMLCPPTIFHMQAKTA